MQPIVEWLKVGELGVMCYLVMCPATARAAIVDPGAEPERISELVRRANATVDFILCTHGHPDHLLAAPELARMLGGVPIAMHEADARFFATDQGRHVATRELGLSPPPAPDIRLHDAQVLRVGEQEIKVLHTPGHSPGSVCYLAEGELFTGDTLFVDAVGRTDLGGASMDELLRSINQKILPLPDQTMIRPGHDYGPRPFATLGEQKRTNPFITEFILGE